MWKLQFRLMFEPFIAMNMGIQDNYGMSSLIIKDMKFLILMSLPHVILELLPQTFEYVIFFLAYFLTPTHGDLENF